MNDRERGDMMTRELSDRLKLMPKYHEASIEMLKLITDVHRNAIASNKAYTHKIRYDYLRSFLGHASAVLQYRTYLTGKSHTNLNGKIGIVADLIQAISAAVAFALSF